MNKRSTKVICCYFHGLFCMPCPKNDSAITRKVMKYGFNHCFGPQLGFPKMLCSISFSFINGCPIENALCSDVISSRIEIGADLPDGNLAISAFSKILFFHLFHFLTMARERRMNQSRQKTKHHIVKRNDKILLNLHL